MGLLKNIGKILALPIDLLNVPARTMENLVDEDTPEEDRIFSKPLKALSDAIKEATDDE